jgi:hypothetical protein
MESLDNRFPIEALLKTAMKKKRASLKVALLNKTGALVANQITIR